MHGSILKRLGRALIWLGALAVLLCAIEARAALIPARADVVVLVDTSTSMRQVGLDPERTSLLVGKLLADIVPGELAAVRLLDLAADRAWLPSHDTGKTAPCPEDPSKTCNLTEMEGNWAELVRKNAYGSLIRSARGDAEFKRSLDQHLEQRANNSLFDLGFRAAQGVFDRHTGGDAPRTVVWLSDGKSEHSEQVREAVDELRAAGVHVTAIVFGSGDTALAESMKLPVRRASSPGELMKAFADVFRNIVQAPYEWDRDLSSEPAFEMKANVDEAWVVAYGDVSLSDAWLVDPSGSRVGANHGQDAWPTAGAYRVAYLQSPRAGSWTVHVTGGGARTAYAVVQRSSLGPLLVEPKTAVTGLPTRVVAAVTAGSDGKPLPASVIPPGTTIELSIDGGSSILLLDDGNGTDAVAGDGQFSVSAVFAKNGSIPVRLRLHGEIIDRTADAVVDVRGSFHYNGGPLHVDFGELHEGGKSCRPLIISAEHTGSIPFDIELLRGLPAEHSVEIVAAGRRGQPGGDPIGIAPGEAIEICLITGARAPSSSALDEPWVKLRVARSTAPDQAVIVYLKWSVSGLSFWQRWGWLILIILGTLFLIFIVMGYVVPRRFRPALAVTLAPEFADLEEQSPQPVAQWHGVGIGFYRHARAYVHANYRLSGSQRGALAVLRADPFGTNVAPGAGQALYHYSANEDWEVVPPVGHLTRRRDFYRSGERGPYFSVALKGQS